MSKRGFNKNTNKSDLKSKVISCVTGALAGFINGLFGGGGGMVVVPMLLYFLKMKEKNAHATAILIILPLSIISSISYIALGVLDFSILTPVAVGVVGGGALGAFILSKSKPAFLIVLFSIVMAIAGVKMLFF